MFGRNRKAQYLEGPAGKLEMPPDDEVGTKLAMLYEGVCTDLGPVEAAKKYGYSKQRFYQLRATLKAEGAVGLQDQKRGPKTKYRRTEAVEREVIRQRFLDPEASPEVITQKLRQTGHSLSVRSVERVIQEYGLQKKLHQCGPKPETPVTISTQRTMTKQREERCDPRSVERGVRQLLADKVSGTSVGLWLLIPEYLRLGVWDLLRGWCGPSCGDLDPRLGLQLVNEAALCVTGIRQRLSLSQRGFELACGLPFVASDTAIHQLLERHTVEQTQELQVALGLLRRQAGDFKGAVFAIDPHRIPSSSKRQMRRFKDKTHTAARKQAQTFFCLDADTNQPLVFTTATATRTASHAAVELMALAARILPHTKTRPVILADTEHLSAELFDHTIEQTPFDLLTPQSRQKGTHKDMPGIPESQWNHHWAGYATTTRPYRFVNGKHELHQLVQRENERTQDHIYKTFIATAPRDELQSLTRDYPNRWHIEQFFDTYQHLGWNRAGTMDLNIRYGHMTTALIAQAAIERLRRRLGAPYDTWEAPQLARHLFSGIDGDIRVRNNTVVVTFYNAPNLAVLRQHYQHLPQRLRDEDICPNIPWLYDLPLEFRFR